MEIDPIVLDGRHADVGARGQAPGALVGRLVAAYLISSRNLAKPGDIRPLAIAELLGEPDRFRYDGRGCLHLRYVLGEHLAPCLLLALREVVYLLLVDLLLSLDRLKGNILRANVVINIGIPIMALRALILEQRGDLVNRLTVIVDQRRVLLGLPAVEPDDWERFFSCQGVHSLSVVLTAVW